MNIQELTTWNRLLALNFDAADAAFPFTARLARDNGWPRSVAARAIEEYRKFCFLAAHAGHPVTPSDEVDQVWHLHLTYSRHYWDSLCRDTLDQPLHHGPTQGGVEEERKFGDWYGNTLASYRRYFGEPPADLWPAARERFDEHNEFVRINRRDVVTLERATLKRGALAVLGGSGLLTVAHALAQTEDAAKPGSGLVVFALVAVVVVLLIGVIRRRRSRGGPARHRAARKRHAGDGAVAGGFVPFVPGDSSSKHSNDDNGGDSAAGGETDGGGTVTGGMDGGQGCGAANGCGSSGGGGGCGGGGS
jgi:hypothetical protein